MANITEVSQWENVIRQLENGEAATGGADGLANVQAKQLANRTQWLKGNLAPIVNAAFRGTLKHENNDLAGSAIVAESLGTNGYIKYASGLIIQWGSSGSINDSSEGLEITFPIQFHTEVFTLVANSSTGGTAKFYITTKRITTINAYLVANGSIPDGSDSFCKWLAIGW